MNPQTEVSSIPLFTTPEPQSSAPLARTLLGTLNEIITKHDLRELGFFTDPVSTAVHPRGTAAADLPADDFDDEAARATLAAWALALGITITHHYDTYTRGEMRVEESKLRVHGAYDGVGIHLYRLLERTETPLESAEPAEQVA